MDHETLGGRIPKGERRVRFADSMGMELVSIFLTDLFVLASHTPYTDYHEQRKPPSSRLSSTLQAIQYNHEPHNNNTSSNSNNNNYNYNYNYASNRSPSNTCNHHSGQHHNWHHMSSNNYKNSYHSKNNSANARSIISNKSNSNSHHESAANYQHQYQHHHQHHYHQHNYLHNQAKLAVAAAAAATSAPSAPASSTRSPSPPIPSATAALSTPTEYICEFTQPISLISFKERVKLKKVQLENCYINSTAGHVSLTCNIRVLNISYDKSVSVRYTTDDWHTHSDSLASYKPGSCDGWSDRFSSTVSIINKLKPGQRIMFAIRYAAGDSVYWDNNGGINYSVKNKCNQSR